MSRLVLIGLLVMGMSASATSEVAAEIEGLRLEVDGLSCPFCVIGLDKQLKRHAGLEDIEIHLKQGVTEATLPADQGIDVEKIRLAVKEAGFTLRGITVTVIGHIHQDEESFAVESRGDGTRFLLFDAEHQDAGQETVLDQALQQQLERAEHTQQLVKIRGRVHEHAGLPAAIMVESFDELAE